MKIKQIKRKFNNRLGFKERKFMKKVNEEFMHSLSADKLAGSFKSGFERARLKKLQAEMEQEEEEAAKEIEAVKEICKHNLKEFVLGTSTLAAKCCTMQPPILEKESDRANEIFDRCQNLVFEIYEEIDNGEYEYLYELDDEKNRPFIKVLDLIFTNRIVINADYTKEEAERFWDFYYNSHATKVNYGLEELDEEKLQKDWNRQ